MKHLEKRANLFYAVLTVPPDVRQSIGKLRYVQSTQTGNKAEAGLRAALLVAGWKSEITKARGKLPDANATFWEGLRAEFINSTDEDHESAVRDLIEAAVQKVPDQQEASDLWKFATGQTTPLGPLVTEWRAALALAPKTMDQMQRDVQRMAAHFVNLEALAWPSEGVD